MFEYLGTGLQKVGRFSLVVTAVALAGALAVLTLLRLGVNLRGAVLETAVTMMVVAVVAALVGVLLIGKNFLAEVRWRNNHRTHGHLRRFLLNGGRDPLYYEEDFGTVQLNPDASALANELLAGGEGIPPGTGPYGKSEVEWAAERAVSKGADGLNGLLELCRLGIFECVGREWSWSYRLWVEHDLFWRAVEMAERAASSGHEPLDFVEATSEDGDLMGPDPR